MNSKNKIYSIGEASRLTGVTVKQIRNWEEKRYIPAPMRVVCGERSYRHYAEADLNVIRKIKLALEKGFTLAAAAKTAVRNQSEKKEGGNDNE